MGPFWCSPTRRLLLFRFQFNLRTLQTNTKCHVHELGDFSAVPAPCRQRRFPSPELRSSGTAGPGRSDLLHLFFPNPCARVVPGAALSPRGARGAMPRQRAAVPGGPRARRGGEVSEEKSVFFAV